MAISLFLVLFFKDTKTSAASNIDLHTNPNNFIAIPEKRATKIEYSEADSTSKTSFFFLSSLSDFNIRYFDDNYLESVELIGDFSFSITNSLLEKDDFFINGKDRIINLIALFNHAEFNHDAVNNLLKVIITDDRTPITLQDLREVSKSRIEDHIEQKIDLEECYKIVRMLGEIGIAREKAKILLLKLLIYSFSEKLNLPRNYCSLQRYIDFAAIFFININIYTDDFGASYVKFNLEDESIYSEFAPQCFEWVYMYDNVGFVMSFRFFCFLISKVR